MEPISERAAQQDASDRSSARAAEHEIASGRSAATPFVALVYVAAAIAVLVAIALAAVAIAYLLA